MTVSILTLIVINVTRMHDISYPLRSTLVSCAMFLFHLWISLPPTFFFLPQVLLVWSLSIPLPAVLMIAVSVYFLLLVVALWCRYCLKVRLMPPGLSVFSIKKNYFNLKSQVSHLYKAFSTPLYIHTWSNPSAYQGIDITITVPL